MLDSVYRSLPASVQQQVKEIYYGMSSEEPFEVKRDRFVSVLGAEESFPEYEQEFDNIHSSDIFQNAITEYRQLTGKSEIGGFSSRISSAIYATVRTLEPRIVVETGVCNGVSTTTILSAMEANGFGELHSIDYPLRADESLEEFRDETFREYGGAAIPSDKSPGWIVPEEYQHRWELHLGKSQELLPDILSTHADDGLDLFLHDSEHSLLCQAFEFELVWPRLNSGGLLLADDTGWSRAWEAFCEERVGSTHSGVLWNEFGYGINRE
jgi:predicted O-methyltransferase YrrM